MTDDKFVKNISNKPKQNVTRQKKNPITFMCRYNSRDCRNASDTEKSMQALQVECQSLQFHPHFSYAVLSVFNTMSHVVLPLVALRCNNN